MKVSVTKSQVLQMQLKLIAYTYNLGKCQISFKVQTLTKLSLFAFCLFHFFFLTKIMTPPKIKTH